MRRLPSLLIATGLFLLIGGGVLLFRGPATSGDLAAVEQALRTEPSGPTPAQSPEVTTTTVPDQQPADRASESSPTEPEPLPQPVGLRIESLEVDAPVVPYGVDSSGQMDVPDNVTEVAWYRFGPKPGESGSAVLAAHVDLADSGPGVFFALNTLEEGDQITVVYEDESESEFRVVARGVYEKNELPLDVIFSREGPAVLTLITCGGDFNRSISRYDSNVVVYAVPLGDEIPSGGSLL